MTDVPLNEMRKQQEEESRARMGSEHNDCEMSSRQLSRTQKGVWTRQKNLEVINIKVKFKITRLDEIGLQDTE